MFVILSQHVSYIQLIIQNYLEYFLKAKQIYDDAEKKFSNNEKFCIAGLNYKLILDYDKMREINSVSLIIIQNI